MEKERWGSRIGVILAVAGSAVGLGNFLRFPGQAAMNGGGAFLLPYFISLLVLGIPLCWAEWTMGRYAGVRGFNSAPGVFTVIWRHPLAKYLGGIALIVPLVIYMYYVLIESWCLAYALNYATGDLMREAGQGEYQKFFDEHVGMAENGAALVKDGGQWVVVLAATFLFNFVLIYRGVAKGIETFCRVAMPLMLVLALIVLVRVLTLDPHPDHPDQSVLNGLGFMWNPQPEKLASPGTWLAASGQIFFSLSVGFGIIINYASYLSQKDDVVLSGLTSSSMNEFFEVCLGGLITIPAAFVFIGVVQPEFLQSSFKLGFVALPNVFASMWGGQLFGFLWFLMLFIAAITSSVSMLQPVIAFLEEGFGLKRHASAAILGLISALGSGFVLYFSKDLVALDTFDFWVSTVLIFVLAMVQAFLYGWVLGIDRGQEEAHRGAHIRIPRFVQYMLKYVVPVYLLAIFIGFCWQDLPSRDIEKFQTDSSHMATDRDQRLSGHLLALLKANDVAPPDEHTVVADPNRPGEWRIKDANGRTTHVLVRDGGQLSVRQHKAGKVEGILASDAALMSVLFIVAVLVFLMLLIHIAGRRWKAQGRFDNLDALPEVQR